jgi:hypothetical protein
MNYFAHGRNFVDTPPLLAGTAVPDWLSVVDRRVRARAKLARPWMADTDPLVAGVARGVVRHHFDDAWFHQTQAFVELSLQFTVDLREVLPDDNGFRHSFLGHILVEILLDAALIEEDPTRLDAYYAALEQLDVQRLADAIHRMTTGHAARLGEMIHLFCRERFLYDYLDDDKLLGRLNRVMQRVNLPQLPSSMRDFLRSARQPVRQRLTQLLDDSRAVDLEEKNP